MPQVSILQNNFMLVYYWKVKIRDKINVSLTRVGSGLAHKHETRNKVTLSNKQASLVHSIRK